jgi:hypothetical protein
MMDKKTTVRTALTGYPLSPVSGLVKLNPFARLQLGLQGTETIPHHAARFAASSSSS